MLFILCNFQTLVPEFVSVYLMISSGSSGNASDLAVLASNLRTFRILRALKMVTRFNNVRLIVLAVTKAFQVCVNLTYMSSQLLMMQNTCDFGLYAPFAFKLSPQKSLCKA